MKYLFALSFVLFFQNIYGQEKNNDFDSLKFGLHLGTVKYGQSLNLSYYVGFIFEKGKHTLDISPLINDSPYGAASQTIKPLINGFQLGYEVDPYEKGRVFEFFFFYNFLFQHFKYNTTASSSLDENSTIHIRFFNNTIGSGFRWNLSDRFYLKNKMGVGFQNKRNYEDFETMTDILNSSFKETISFHLGLGIRF
jgi:hypothetical protein